METETLIPSDLREWSRKGQVALSHLQSTLLPEHGSDIIAIEPETREYVLGKTEQEAYERFRERFPDRMAWMSRCDGGPVFRFRNRVK